MNSAKRRWITGATAAALFGVAGGQALIANSDRSRTIALYNIHTKEKISVLYKQDGRYVPEAMEKINWAMRDWRQNEPTKMDPALIDLLWEVHTELGSNEPIHIISGYRSRGTNEMLRKTVGGQASESRHILGKAADVHFPDVPLKRMRYSALVRERGGVGYYPTSAIPFVHLDTDRIRHWPRLPRYELALLFPNGNTQHQPADGGTISREDVQVAQTRHKDLAVQVAEFHQARGRPVATVQVASAAGVKSPDAKVAAAVAPVTLAAFAPPQPKLTAEPRLVDRPSRFTPRPSDDERIQLTQLVALASFEPQLIAPPAPVSRPRPAKALPSLTGTPIAAASPPPTVEAPRIAALMPAPNPMVSNDAGRAGWGTGWVQAPEFDEEHPEELSYRPFPVAPYMTTSASADDPALTRMIHPDVSKTLEMLDAAGSVPPMKLRPGQQVAQVLWAQQFKGGMANIARMFESGEALLRPNGVNNRTVKTGG